jgi:hypothetical protein
MEEGREGLGMVQTGKRIKVSLFSLVDPESFSCVFDCS